MRTCEKNKQIIHWKKYIGIQEKVEDGEYTGEFVKTFKSPVALRVNIISGKSIEETYAKADETFVQKIRRVISETVDSLGKKFVSWKNSIVRLIKNFGLL